MRSEDLHELISAGESFTTEFKTGSVNDAEIVDAVACLANGDGGYLILGVRDDGTVTGARHRHEDRTDPRRLQALIVNKTEPSVVPSVDIIDYEGHELIVVTVPTAMSVVATSSGKYTRRSVDVHGQPQCVPMRPHEVLARAGSIGVQDYTRVALPDARFHELDSTEIARLRTLAQDGGDAVLRDLSDVDLLRALALITHEDMLTMGAILLFGQEDVIARHVPTHEVSFQVLDKLKVKVNRMDRTPLLRAMSEIADAIRPYNPEEELEIGLFRVGLPRYAMTAIRELVANALVHRDYTATGAIHVQIDGADLTVTNPGGFPEGVTTDNILVAPPRPRNPLIADVFKRAGLVERTGRGINRVFESQLALGRPAPDYGRSTDTWVQARLRAGPADRDLAAFIVESRRRGQEFSLRDLLVLHEVRQERRITSRRAAELFQVGQDEARAELNRLVEEGLLEARGERKGRTYHLAASVYRRLGEATQYVRTRGFDDLQQEQMVLTYVDGHGSISRSEAAELCQLSSDQASRLLRRLRDKGMLDLVGDKRRARYVRPTTP